MNILIKNITALLPDGEGIKAKICDICISGDRIVSVDSAPENFIAQKVINGSGKMAIPGLINC
ncbi:MAG: N-ethylammeline chlorohydrolase, partial [Oscillospiraceae bacterium]|nr:N-ethylammeline chlorohydrolase [Oscillospiraceae bacterium]